MRAVRFSAQLGFEIESCTKKAMNELVNNLDNISNERINSELCKIMCSNYAYLIIIYKDILCKIIPEFKECIDYNQNNPYHIYALHKHIGVALIEAANPDMIVNLSILFHDIGKPHCCTVGEDRYSHFKGHGRVSADITESIMKRLKFDNDTISKVKELVFYHDATFDAERKHVKRWLNKLGEDQFRRLLKIRVADIKAQNPKYEKERIEKISGIQMLLDDILQENECFTLKDLAINGKDLIEQGIPQGRFIGEILETLLIMVIDGEIKNEKENLIHMSNILIRSK
jgi:tRNA nucleotidyltransferase (CCA-adding enzyme)